MKRRRVLGPLGKQITEAMDAYGDPVSAKELVLLLKMPDTQASIHSITCSIDKLVAARVALHVSGTFKSRKDPRRFVLAGRAQRPTQTPLPLVSTPVVAPRIAARPATPPPRPQRPMTRASCGS